LLVENVVERRRRDAEKQLSPDPGYGDDEEKVKAARQPFREGALDTSALDVRSMDMVEVVEG
jgi:hypothetical protein